MKKPRLHHCRRGFSLAIESGVRLVLFDCFQGFWRVLDHFFGRLRVFLGSRFVVNDRGRRGLFRLDNHRRRFGSNGSFLGRSSRGGSQFGSLACFFLALATAYFTWVVRCAAIAGQDHRWGFHRNRSRFFSDHWCGFDNRSGLRLSGDRRFHGSRLGNRRFDGGRFGSPLEGGLDFLSRFGSLLDDRCFNCRCFSRGSLDSRGFGGWSLHDWSLDRRLRCDEHRQLGGSGFDRCFSYRRSFANLGDFHFRCGDHLNRGGRFNGRRFSGRGFQGGGGGTFSLLMRFGFGVGADRAAGNGGGHGQAGSQFGAAGFGLL
ncbi:hypothetical protein PF70_05964, partial [Pseudomonas asplenii]